jgi:predicted GNAT superfamily acetyltransferase
MKSRVSLITWTFDPLESRNAHLNFNKLGITIRHYYRNLYGTSPTSQLHSGIGTDRFLAEWWINRKGKIKISNIDQADWGLQSRAFRKNFRTPEVGNLNLDSPTIAIEIPRNIQKLKIECGETAWKWRMESRKVLTHYLRNGYQVVGFRSSKCNSGCWISYYLLQKTG